MNLMRRVELEECGYSNGFGIGWSLLMGKHCWVNGIPTVLYCQLEDDYVLEKLFMNYLFAWHVSQEVINDKVNKEGLRNRKHPYRMLAKQFKKATPGEIQNRWDARRLARATSKAQATARLVRL